MEIESQKQTEEEQNLIGKKQSLKENNLLKEMIQSGCGSTKPLEIDIVVASIKCFLPSGQSLKYFTFENREFSLEGKNIPKAVKLGITNMRKNEISKFFIKANYIFKHFINFNIPFPSPIDSEGYRSEISKEKLIFEIHLIDFFMVQNLYDNGEIKKKCIRNGLSMVSAKLPNKVHFSLRCKYQGKEIYARDSDSIFLDNSDKENLEIAGNKIQKYQLFDIERRILQSMKVNELASVIVKPSIMLEKNKDFLAYYAIEYKKPENFEAAAEKIMKAPAKTSQELLTQEREKDELYNYIAENDIYFECEMHNIEKYEYIFKPDKDILSKKLIVTKGFGKDSPDRESISMINMLIKIDGQIVFNSFNSHNNSDNNLASQQICDLTDNPFSFAEAFEIKAKSEGIKAFRKEINNKYNIELDMDLEYDRDLKVFKEIQNNHCSALSIDLREYSIPIILRKVLIHMKRGELAYISTGYIDYFSQNDVEVCDKVGKIQIYVFLYDYLHRKLFSKMNLEEKYDDLIQLKELANSFFKANKLFRASKIYQNINYRFNFGDVFGMIFEENELPIKNQQPDLYKKLNDIRISCHNNLSTAKLKLGKLYAAFTTADKVLIL